MSTVLIDGDTIYYRVEYGDHSIEEAKERLDKLVERVIETCFADEVKIAVKGSGNFRNEVYAEYKANRKRDDRKKLALKHFISTCVTHTEQFDQMAWKPTIYYVSGRMKQITKM